MQVSAFGPTGSSSLEEKNQSATLIFTMILNQIKQGPPEIIADLTVLLSRCMPSGTWQRLDDTDHATSFPYYIAFKQAVERAIADQLSPMGAHWIKEAKCLFLSHSPSLHLCEDSPSIPSYFVYLDKERSQTEPSQLAQFDQFLQTKNITNCPLKVDELQEKMGGVVYFLKDFSGNVFVLDIRIPEVGPDEDHHTKKADFRVVFGTNDTPVIESWVKDRVLFAQKHSPVPIELF